MKNVVIPLAFAIAAIAAPITTHLGVSAYGEYRVASIRNADLKRQQLALKEFTGRLVEYKRFAARVERFIANTHTAGVVDGSWNRHHVDIKDRVVSFTELAQLIADHADGENYYFLPSKLQIQARGAGGFANPFVRGGAKTSRDELTVSLVGDFLVPIE